MAGKVRFNVFLDPAQLQKLQAESDRTGAKKAELIRRAIAAYLAKTRKGK